MKGRLPQYDEHHSYLRRRPPGEARHHQMRLAEGF